MTTTTSITIELVQQTCGDCGTVFGMSRDFYDERIRDKRSWYCPNGHRRAFLGKSHAQQLKDAEQAISEVREYAERQGKRADENFRSLTATKGHMTRLRNQIAAGTCPLCQEEVAGLKAHMAERHPEGNVREGEA